MKICLETSSIIRVLKDEPDCQPVEELLALAETVQAEVFVSGFAWDETYKTLDRLGNRRRERLKRVAKHLPRVARIGEWELRSDVLGHGDSAETEQHLSEASRSDKERFLSFAAPK